MTGPQVTVFEGLHCTHNCHVYHEHDGNLLQNCVFVHIK